MIGPASLQVLAAHEVRAHMLGRRRFQEFGSSKWLPRSPGDEGPRGLILHLGANACGEWEMEIAMFPPLRHRAKRCRTARDSLLRLCVDTLRRDGSTAGILVPPGEMQVWSFEDEGSPSWWQNHDIIGAIWREVKHLRKVARDGTSPLCHVGQVLNQASEFEPDRRWFYPAYTEDVEDVYE